MNTATKELLSFFLSRYPGSDEVLFKMLVETWLTGNKIDKTWENISLGTAEILRQRFASISEEGIRDWAFGLLMQKAGNNPDSYSNKVKDTRF